MMANISNRATKVLCQFYGSSMTVIPVRWRGRRRRSIPENWREVDHNPAKIPWAWIPDKWKEENTIDYEREQELGQYVPGYEPKIRDVDHPDYHQRATYSFHSKTKLVEGLKQALCLTKSILYEEMPKKIQELMGLAEIPNQDDKVISVLQHAHLFDIDPINFDTEGRRSHYYQDNFKIFPTIQRYCPLILENLIRLCYQHPYTTNHMNSRLLLRDLTCSTHTRRIVERNAEMMSDVDDDWLVSFNFDKGMQLLSKYPMQRFADDEDVNKTVSEPLSTTFPILPVVDLTKRNIYKNVISTGLLESAPISNLHTIFIQNLTGLTAEELYGQMTCQLFASLHARAVSKYGLDPLDLPESISGQAIGTDGQNFQFLCMQLNTTKLNSDDGVKNIVWINAIGENLPLSRKYLPMPMYERCSHKVWQDPGYCTGYDPCVFKLFLAMWINGTV